MNYSSNSPAIILMGPSAAGKTAISLELAKKYPVEIISVDSAMVFKGMDIGSCKPTLEEQKMAPHHLLDILEPDQNFNAGIFLDHVEQALTIITKNKKVPLFVGGSMMFYKLLLDGIHDFPSDLAVRTEIELTKRKKGDEALIKELEILDPETFRAIDLKNPRRVARALEIIKITNTKLSQLKQRPKESLLNKKNCLLLGISGSKEELDLKAALRIEKILNAGFLIELEKLVTTYKLNSNSHSMNSINYKQFLSYLEGKISLEEAKKDALSATRKLIKTQRTWMKKFQLNYVKIASDENDSKYFSDTINTYLRSYK